MGTVLLVLTILCAYLAHYVSPIRRLERQLRDPDEEVRLLAAERLGYLGSDARSATKAILKATSDSSSKVRVKAVWALSRVSGRADLLVPLLADTDADVSLAAAEGMLWVGHDPRKVVPTLLKLSFSGLADQDVGSIFEATSPAQSAIVVPLLLDSLWSAEEAEQHDEGDPAMYALRVVAVPAPTVVPRLIERLSCDRPEVRTSAAEQLLRLGQSATEAAPALRARLHDSDPACAAACAAALGAIDPDDPDFLPILTRTLRTDALEWPRSVGDYLFMLGPNAAGAADDLVTYISNDQKRPRWDPGSSNAVNRLAEAVGPEVVSELDRKLQQTLADPNRTPGDARMAVNDLASLGPSAAPALPTLITALDDPDVRGNAINALRSIGKRAAPAVPHLLRFLDSKEQGLSYVAFDALKKIGGEDEAARARLRPFLQSSDRLVRLNAATALVAFKEPADQILPALTELAVDPHFGPTGEGVPMGESFFPGTRDGLVANIASLGSEAVARLTLALDDANPKVRRVAVEALGKIGPASKDAVPRLIELLDDEPSWDAAARALGGIGPEAREAVPKLLDVLVAMRQPPSPGDYDANEYDPNDYDWSGYDRAEYLPRLDALAGIGEDARVAASEVLRLTNSEDTRISQTAVLTLARIDPANPSLMPRMRRLLAEWDRESVLDDGHSFWAPDDPLKKFVDIIWHLGPHGEPLTPDLQRIMTADHLVNRQVRCYAAFALARFDTHRPTAVAYLQHIINSAFPESFDTGNLAYALLQRINGERKSPTFLMAPLGVGP